MNADEIEQEFLKDHDEIEALTLACKEIERLRKDVVHWREARRTCLEAGDMMKAEIERLNSELLAERLANIGKVHPCDDSTATNLASALADNERLRENLKVEQHYIKKYRDGYCKQAAEIEQLRGEADLRAKQLQTHIVALLDAEKKISGLENANQDLVDEIDTAKREIERLHADLLTARCEAEDMSGEIAALRTQAERDRWVINATYQVQNDLRAEIERLREELLTRDTKLRHNAEEIGRLRGLLRVSEALGESSE